MANTPTTDLTSLYTDGTTNWAELSNYGNGAAPSLEEEAYLQGSNCVSQQIASNKTGAASGLDYSATNPTAFVDGDDVFFFWWLFLFPSALNDYNETVGQTAPGTNSPGTASGFFIGIGSGATNHDWYAVGGADYGRYPYGGWQNVAIDPLRDASFTDGPPTASTYTNFGFLPNVTSAPSRGQSLVVDAIRWGRGLIQYTGGSPAGTFDDIADTNDTVTNRWGLFQRAAGSFLWKGKLELGTAGSSLLFNASNRNINIDDTRQVYAGFNLIEINNASTSVTWDNITFSKLRYDDTLAFDNARGIVVVNDGATVDIMNCGFVDMDRFQFGANTTIETSSFRRCNKVDQGGSSLNIVTFDNSTDSAAALVVSGTNALDLNDITNCTFVSSPTNRVHALRLGNITTNVSRNIDGNTFDGYGVGSTGSTTGITGTDSAAIEVNVSSGVTLTLSVINGGDVPTFQNLGAGTVSITQAVTVNINGLKDNSEVRIYTAGTTTELFGVESVSGGSGTGINGGTVSGSTDDNTFSFSTSSGANIDIRIFNLNFDSTQFLNFTVSATGDNIEAVQVEDRVFSNP